MPANHKVYIYPIAGRQAELEEVRIALAAIECTEEVTTAEEAEVIIILVCADTPDDAALGGVVSAAADGKLRALGIYARDSDGSLPKPLERYGTSAIPLDLDKLRRIICGGERIWTDGGGKPRAEQGMDRHCK